MYMAGRTRTASSPSRMRMSSAPYEDSETSSVVVLVSSFMSPVPSSPCVIVPRSGTAPGPLCSFVSRGRHLSVLHREEAGGAPQPPRPARMRGGHEGLPAAGHLVAERRRALLVELGVEIVEQGHRGLPLFFAIHAQGGQGQGQEQAARLSRGGHFAGLLSVHLQRHLVAVRAHQRATGPAFVAPALF